MKYALILSMLAGPAMGDPMNVERTAQALFDRLPSVVERGDFTEQCGHDGDANPAIAYCTTRNIIFVARGFWDRDTAGYEVAHVYGHAIQVQHGVADIAFREISRRRSEEDALRGMVTRQVECVAGVLMALAGEPPMDLRAFDGEPFTDSHWGRDPLHRGPQVSIGLEPRAEWYDIGYAARDFAACTVGEISSALIVEALR